MNNKKANLFIDTSQASCNLAIFNNDKIIKKSSCLTHNNLTDIVVEKIAKLSTGYEISNIYITNGPGSFTGQRVSCLIAKSWMIIKKTNVYTIDTLTFQLKSLNGISIIDAKSNRSYVCVYKNTKCLLQPKIVLNTQLEQIKNKYKNLKIYENYKNINVFDNLLSLVNIFKKINTINEITPKYLKEVIYDQKNK